MYIMQVSPARCALSTLTSVAPPLALTTPPAYNTSGALPATGASVRRAIAARTARPMWTSA